MDGKLAGEHQGGLQLISDQQFEAIIEEYLPDHRTPSSPANPLSLSFETPQHNQLPTIEQIHSPESRTGRYNASNESEQQIDIHIDCLQKNNAELAGILRLRNEERDQLILKIEILEQKHRKIESEGREARALFERKENEMIQLRKTADNQLENIQSLQDQVKQLKQQFMSISEALQEERKISQEKYTQYQQKILQLQSLKPINQPALQKQNQSVPQQPLSPTDFRLQYSHSQIKIFELENTIKQRENKIRKLQNNIQTLKLKANHSNSLSENQELLKQEVEVLRKKIEEQESRKSGSRTYRSRDWEATEVFEHRVVYELKKQNQKLKQIISKTASTSRSARPPQSSRIPQTNQQSYISTIQQRLNEFNQKLTDLTNDSNRNTEVQVSRHRHSQDMPYPQQFTQRAPNCPLAHIRQIQNLQARLVDLQRYCATLQADLTGPMSQQTSSAFVLSSKKAQQKILFNDQIQYYRDKNKELEARVNVLLNLNKELKIKLEYYMKPSNQINQEFYKLEAEKTAKRVVVLENSVAELKKENNLVVEKLKNRKNEYDIAKLQLQISQKSAKISSLTTQLSALKSQLTELETTKTTIQSQLQSTQSILQQQLLTTNTLQQQISTLKSQQSGLLVKIQNLTLELETERESAKQRENQRERERDKQREKERNDRELSLSKFRELEREVGNLTNLVKGKDQQIKELSDRLASAKIGYQNQVTKAFYLTEKLKSSQDLVLSFQTQLVSAKQQESVLMYNSTLQQNQKTQLLSQIQQLTQQLESVTRTTQNLESKNLAAEASVLQLRDQIEAINMINSQRDMENEREKQKQREEKDNEDRERKYYVQLVRSVLLEVQAIAEEGVVSQEKIGVLGCEIGKGLKACGYLHQ